MPGGKSIRAVLVDALGTLIELDPPWLHLAAELGREPDERMERAFRSEMAYYREHSHEGRDAESLRELRERCARIISEELGQRVSVPQMMNAIRFRAFDDAAPGLAELRELGLRLVCISNWDYALPQVLVRCGLGHALDGVVTSAEAGARKPDPAIFERGLSLATAGPEEAVHVGDSPAEDIEGARAAGVRALLIRRDGGGDIESLTAIRHHLGL
jgi:putative hydrolase of the HAD superfamily